MANEQVVAEGASCSREPTGGRFQTPRDHLTSETAHPPDRPFPLQAVNSEANGVGGSRFELTATQTLLCIWFLVFHRIRPGAPVLCLVPVLHPILLTTGFTSVCA